MKKKEVKYQQKKKIDICLYIESQRKEEKHNKNETLQRFIVKRDEGKKYEKIIIYRIDLKNALFKERKKK